MKRLTLHRIASLLYCFIASAAQLWSHGALIRGACPVKLGPITWCPAAGLSHWTCCATWFCHVVHFLWIAQSCFALTLGEAQSRDDLALGVCCLRIGFQWAKAAHSYCDKTLELWWPVRKTLELSGSLQSWPVFWTNKSRVTVPFWRLFEWGLSWRPRLCILGVPPASNWQQRLSTDPAIICGTLRRR